MERFGNQQMRDAYARYQARKHDFLALADEVPQGARTELRRASTAATPKSASVKARLFQELKDEYQVLKGSWGGYAGYDRFFEQPLSNAHLASIATYEDFVPAFRALLRSAKAASRASTRQSSAWPSWTATSATAS